MKNTERIDQLKMAIFVLECKDHWDSKDWSKYYDMNAELNRLESENA